MKKIASLTLVFALCLCLCACGSKNETPKNETPNRNIVENETEPQYTTVELSLDNWQEY